MELDWNDLRTLLEIERSGTVRAAATRLRVHHTTISRHLARLQSRLGVRLVQRDGRRLAFTPAGQQLLATAHGVDRDVTAVSRKLTGRDLRPHGLVRIAAPESFVSALAPHVAPMAARFPGIRIDFSAGLGFKNMARMEADIVVRVVASPAESLVGRRVGTLQVRAYGHEALLSTPPPHDLAAYPWIGWSQHLAHFPMEAWFRSQTPPITPQLTTDSETALIALVTGGAGVGFLPEFVTRVHPSLRRVEADGLPTFETQAWVLMHADLRAVERMRIVSQWLNEICSAHLTASDPTQIQ